MKTLYRQFIVATLVILTISITIGFMVTNIVYVTSTKHKMDQQNVVIAQNIADSLQSLHSGKASFDGYLNSIGELGYQIYIQSASGFSAFYGEPFTRTELPTEAMIVIEQGEVYHGVSHFNSKLLMMSHFSNDLQNTVGVPFIINDERYALFLRPNNKLLFSDVHKILAWLFVGIAFVSICGVLLLARHLTKPITKLTEATKEIARENFNYPLHIVRNDELGELAESFNRMQRQLQHNDEARKAFISNVSHDFQSPLMNIRGYADLLKSSDVNEQERIEYLDIIDHESKRLSNLTRQLLLLTSLDQRDYPLKLMEVRLDEQMKELLRRYQWRLEEKEIELSYKLTPAIVKGDSELLINVWENLLTNAIKYNKMGGSIHITLSPVVADEQTAAAPFDARAGMRVETKPGRKAEMQSGRKVETQTGMEQGVQSDAASDADFDGKLQIAADSGFDRQSANEFERQAGAGKAASGVRLVFSDTGIGMSEQEVEQIFERFYRVDTARDKEGSGLGLSIVQQIVKLHRGSIAVSSELGQGTTFTVMLPIYEQTAPAAHTDGSSQ